MEFKEAGFIDENQEGLTPENNETEFNEINDNELEAVAGGLGKKETGLGECTMCGGKMVKSRRDNKPVCSKCGAMYYLA